MKHGPIALIEPGVMVVGVATDSHVQAKTLSNMEEMKARGGTIVLVVEEGDDVGHVADHVIRPRRGQICLARSPWCYSSCSPTTWRQRRDGRDVFHAIWPRR